MQGLAPATASNLGMQMSKTLSQEKNAILEAVGSSILVCLQMAVAGWAGRLGDKAVTEQQTEGWRFRSVLLWTESGSQLVRL